MTNEEIKVFIKEMGKIGDEWTAEQVKDVFGNYTLQDALNERSGQVDTFLNTLVTAALGKNKK